MTNKEAYTWILDHFAPCDDGTKQDEALGVALEALEKQTWLEKSKLRDSLDMAIAALRNEQKSEESFSVSKGDVIYRQAAIDAVGKYLKKDGDVITIADVVDAAVAIGMLPSAEPEIIRCGECTHKDKKIDYCHCLGITICERDFCSFAKRREDG